MRNEYFSARQDVPCGNEAPQGRMRRSSVPKVLGIVFDLVPFQKREDFFFIRHLRVVFVLILDVADDLPGAGFADVECAVSLLPFEFGARKGFVYPS